MARLSSTATTLRGWVVVLISGFLAGPGLSGATWAADAGSAATTLVEAKAFPLQGPIAELEPELLDYRYAPRVWQACIGLPDDPYKSIVGSDGGLYYRYGSGPFNGFGVRVLTSLEVEGSAGKTTQSLFDARTPLVITQQRKGSLLLRQEAWAGAPEQKPLAEWSARRVDYLWLKLKNEGRQPTKGRIVVSLDGKNVVPNAERTRFVESDDPKKTFCILSTPCDPLLVPHPGPLTAERPPAVLLGWAHPSVRCDARFRNVLVGYNHSLVFKYRGEPGRKYRVALGLIEGWHTESGNRPLEIRLNGQTARTVDLVKTFGRNVPAVLGFDVVAEKRDGILTIAVAAPEKTKDGNTILSGLWIFDAGKAPTEAEILAGGVDKQALAVMDADRAVKSQAPRLTFTRELAPGEEPEVFLTFPQGPQAVTSVEGKNPARERERALAFWHHADLPYDRINVPDRAVQKLIDSCIRNIYQAREIKNGRPAFQVGPTCYRGTWAADGPFILEAITYLGRANEVRAGLENQVDHDDGPQGVEFSKKSGLRLWMICRHYQLTGDQAWLQRMWPRVEREVHQIIAYRKMTRSDPAQANFGLMPRGFGDGGLDGVHREYTNVYWTLAGLRAAIDLAQKLDRPTASAWKTEYQDYWKAFDKARQRDKLTDTAGHVYVPVTMKGEQVQLPQRGAWAFLQSIFPGRIFAADDALMLGTMAMLDANQREGQIYGTGWIADGIWNYAGSFYAHAHLWLKHGRKAAATLYAFGNHACPLGCWREEQKCRVDSEGYVGDMPHNWASAEFLRLVRHLLILERGNELHLLEGLPRKWTRPGDETRLVGIPTSFGPMDLTVQMARDGQGARLEVNPPHREGVARTVIHLEPFDRPVKSVKLNGQDLAGTALTATDHPFTLEVEFGR